MSLKQRLLVKLFNVLDSYVLENEEKIPTETEILQDAYGKHPEACEHTRLHDEPGDVFNYEDPDLLEDEFDLPDKVFPYYKIVGEGYKWYLEPLQATMVKIKLGTTVVKLHDQPDKQGRILVYTPNFYLAIPSEDLIELGYN